MAYAVYHTKSRAIALCGLMAALEMVFLLAGIIPLSTYCCPALAMLALLPVLYEYGSRAALSVYLVTSVLALLLVADLEVALIYVFLGYYPVLRPILNKLPGRVLPLLGKLAVFNAAMLVAYLLIIFIFRLSHVVADLEGASGWMLAALLILGNVTFLLYDVALGRLRNLYFTKLRKLFIPKGDNR